MWCGGTGCLLMGIQIPTECKRCHEKGVFTRHIQITFIQTSVVTKKHYGACIWLIWWLNTFHCFYFLFHILYVPYACTTGMYCRHAESNRLQHNNPSSLITRMHHILYDCVVTSVLPVSLPFIFPSILRHLRLQVLMVLSKYIKKLCKVQTINR